MPNKDEGNLTGEFPFVPQQKRAQKKREALLNSGRILFIERGYEETTAKEIASHAGVATGTFYRYFADKRQMLMALLEDQLDKMMLPEPNWMNGDPEKQIAILLKEHFQYLEQLGIQRVLPELLPKDNELAAVLKNARKQLQVRICLDLERAKEKGLTWEDLDLNAVAWSLIILSEKLPETDGQSAKNKDFDEIAKIICRLVFPPEVLKRLREEN
jgi:TetR/AcrR family transcriptional regulator, mexJK operon transcriptional repressor